MKTKLLLAMLLSFYSFTMVNAEEEEIKIIRSTEQGKIEDDRSLSVLPLATYDETAIYIYTDVATNDVAITIKDDIGNVVYSNVDIASSRCHVFPINMPDGSYLLGIGIGEDYFYGYFSL